jgi:hypothetical protein
MNPVLFDEAELPLEDLAAVGLAAGDRILLSESDMTALLSGRRTGLMTLQDLEYGDLRIASLNAKLSLVSGPDGKPELLVHPTYLRSIPPTYLNDNEIEALETGEDTMLEKEIVDGNGQRRRVLVEFDRETRQFLETDEDKLQAPEEVNGQPLTAEQKARFKRGEEVEVPDGTKLKYTARNREGLRANRIALVVSLMLDCGITYLVIKGIQALAKESETERRNLSPAYEAAKTKAEAAKDVVLFPDFNSHANQHSRGYNRSSAR